MGNKSLFIFYIFILFSCKHELERPTVDLDMIVPIAYSNLNISNIISDTTIIISEGEEGLISLIYEEKLLDINYDSLLILETTTKEKSIRIDSVNFDDVVIEDISTIGNIINQQPLLGWLLPNGSQSEIPSISGIMQNDSINIDASEYFETMTLYNGTLTIEVKNGFPTAISNVNISLYNSTNQELIATFSTPLISSGSIYTESISVAGKTLDNLMIGIINNIDVESSNGLVNINYSDAITTKISITEIKIMEATAYFPNQLLYEESLEYSFDLGSAKITEVGIKEGSVIINALSTLPDTATIIYSLPSLIKDGEIFETSVKVPPNTDGTPTRYIFQVDGYIMDLTGKENRENGDTSNTIYAVLEAYLDSTGELETINKVDSFYLFNEYAFIPEYAKGYLGQDTLMLEQEEVEIKMFDIIESGNIDLESAEIKINIKNYIGAHGTFLINYFNAINSETNQQVFVNNNTNHIIERALLSANNDVTPTETVIEIDAQEIIEILPNKITTNANYYLNPNGQAPIEDFLFPAMPIEAILELKIPLKFIANSLTLSDTSNVEIDNVEEIEALYITLENSLPLEAYINVISLDKNNELIDTLIANQYIQAALLNLQGEVIESSTTNLEIDNIDFTEIKKIKTIAKFSTPPSNNFISIYSTNELNITLSARFMNSIGK